MAWLQRQIELAPRRRGFHLITGEILRALPELARIRTGIAHLFLLQPVTDGALNLGTWQGIYLCEHRDRAGSRRIVVTIHGETRDD